MDAAMQPTALSLAEYVARSDASYTKAQRACVSKLVAIWKDLGNSDVAQHKRELDVCCSAAVAVWSTAVENAEQGRQDLRQEVEANLKLIARIKEQLGDGSVEAPGELQDLSSPRLTLRASSEHVKERLERWRDRKATRMAEFEAIRSVHVALRQQLGMAPPSAEVDLSRANLEYLQMENDKLQAERAERLQKLEGTLSTLGEICREIGEDDKAAAAEVHPSLRHVGDKEARGVLDSIYRLAEAPPAEGSGGWGAVDLSEATSGRLEAKVQEMRALKAERSAHSAELLEVLSSLWGALDVPGDAPERSMLTRLMAGPYRLHSRSLEKCLAEVSRLEGCRAQAMRDLILAKAKQLSALCASTHIAAPDVSGLLQDMSKRVEEGAASGQISEVLAKLVRLLTEVQALASKRAAIVAAVAEVEEARSEAAWLAEWEVDEMRYKGREASRNMQRSIRAGKQRERLPSLIASLTGVLEEWILAEGSPFIFDGKDYQAELDNIRVEQQAAAAERSNKTTRAKDVRAAAAAAAAANGGVHAPRAAAVGPAAVAAQASSKRASMGVSSNGQPPTHLPKTPMKANTTFTSTNCVATAALGHSYGAGSFPVSLLDGSSTGRRSSGGGTMPSPPGALGARKSMGPMNVPPIQSARDNGVHRSKAGNNTQHQSTDFGGGLTSSNPAQQPSRSAATTATAATKATAAAGGGGTPTAAARPAAGAGGADPIQERFNKIINSLPKTGVATLQSRRRAAGLASPSASAMSAKHHAISTACPDDDDNSDDVTSAPRDLSSSKRGAWAAAAAAEQVGNSSKAQVAADGGSTPNSKQAAARQVETGLDADASVSDQSQPTQTAMRLESVPSSPLMPPLTNVHGTNHTVAVLQLTSPTAVKVSRIPRPVA